MEKVIEERINNNKNIFTEKDLQIIKNNDILMQKIYLLGALDNIKSSKKVPNQFLKTLKIL